MHYMCKYICQQNIKNQPTTPIAFVKDIFIPQITTDSKGKDHGKMQTCYVVKGTTP